MRKWICSLVFGAILLAGCTGAPGSQTQIPGCTPDWQCTAWSACSGGLQARTCTDSNACGTTAGKPSESQSCEEWIPYNFQGGEHLEYDLVLNDSESGLQEGYLIWDVGQKDSEGKFLMTINMSIAGAECVTTVTTKGDEITDIQSELIMNPGCFVGLTLLSFTIYSPYWTDIGDRGLESWSYGIPGYTVSFTVDPLPRTYAGVSCTKGTLSRNEVAAMEMCAAPSLGLGIKMTFRDENGAVAYDAELVDYS